MCVLELKVKAQHNKKTKKSQKYVKTRIYV